MKKKAAAEKGGVFSPAKTVAISAGCGAAAVLLVLMAAAAMLSGGSSRSMMFPTTLLAMAAGGLLSGYICGRIMRCNGILYGLFCGAALFFVAFLAEYLLVNGEISPLAIYKLALYSITGMIGGVLGVNHKMRVKKARAKRK